MTVSLELSDRQRARFQAAADAEGLTLDQFLLQAGRQASRRSARKVEETSQGGWTTPAFDPEGPQPFGEYPARTALVRCGPEVRSQHYAAMGAGRQPLVDRNIGWFVPEAAAGITKIARRCAELGIDFQVSSAFRSYEDQLAFYTRYQTWKAAGKPARDSSAFDARTMQVEAAGPPGVGTHQSGRAFDMRLSKLYASGSDLDAFWDLADDYGFLPFYAIQRPDRNASEAWHFDFYGDFSGVFQRYGYSHFLRAVTADVGLIGPKYGDARKRWTLGIQAQLARAGGDLGTYGIDGAYGRTTEGLLRDAGIDPKAPTQDLFEALFNLPTAL